MEREFDELIKKREEQRKLAQEAWNNLKTELIKAFKIYEIVNWLEKNLRKIKWLK
ncbi:hypothetical protein [Lysinibacillus sp. NPDC092081]|uniref:hypothetical protein n=1 Tax=Lysinibacillus sp. NPDC092081 TaxID=3364131 RepID=UPI0037FE9A44